MENLRPEDINDMSPEELLKLSQEEEEKSDAQEAILGEEFLVEDSSPVFSSEIQDIPSGNIALLMDVELDVIIELGRTQMKIANILNLAPGSIIELDKLAGEPVDILVNNRPIAKGEVVVLDENFGVRLTSILNQEQRLKSLG